MVNVIPIKVEYVAHMGDDLTAVNAARVSYNRSTNVMRQKDLALMRMLLENEHMTPFEHCSLSVRIKCPLYIRSQIMRHRTFSFSELSRRYTKSMREYYMHPDFNEDLYNEIERAYEDADGAYEVLLDLGVSKEDARAVLPNGLMTTFYMSGNFRNWMHFIELRDSGHAQREAEYVAKWVKRILQQHFPQTINVWDEVNESKD